MNSVLFPLNALNVVSARGTGTVFTPRLATLLHRGALPGCPALERA
tara:strand:+ start:2747 stop:2884 length:138 start_codon:yes stop_codon:yes gene_type:complete